MSFHSSLRPRAGVRYGPQVQRARDPRQFLTAAIALSLLCLVALPHVAEALGGLMAPARLPGWTDDGGCRIVEVVDGDTIGMACAGRPTERARLTGFDSPELFSPKCPGEHAEAALARRHLAHLLGEADRLGIVRKGHDRYGRVLVALSVDGRPVAREMIDAGLARPYDGGRRGGWCGEGPGVAERGTSAKWVSVDG